MSHNVAHRPKTATTLIKSILTVTACALPGAAQADAVDMYIAREGVNNGQCVKAYVAAADKAVFGMGLDWTLHMAIETCKEPEARAAFRSRYMDICIDTVEAWGAYPTTAIDVCSAPKVRQAAGTVDGYFSCGWDIVGAGEDEYSASGLCLDPETRKEASHPNFLRCTRIRRRATDETPWKFVLACIDPATRAAMMAPDFFFPCSDKDPTGPEGTGLCRMDGQNVVSVSLPELAGSGISRALTQLDAAGSTEEAERAKQAIRRNVALHGHTFYLRWRKSSDVAGKGSASAKATD